MADLPFGTRPLPLTQSFRLSQSFFLRKESFGGLLFSKTCWTVSRLNSTAFEILNCFSEEPIDFRTLLDALRHRYPLSVRDDEVIAAFVENAVRAGLLLTEYSGPRFPQRLLTDDSTLKLPDQQDTTAPLASFLSAPFFVWWDITAACNLGCAQCYSASGRPLPDELTTAQVCHILDQLAEKKVFYVYFLGGEPLIRRDFFTILEHCRHLDLGVMISTNGWFVDRDAATRLRALGVHHVRVSVDGSSEHTHDSIRGVVGSFRRAVDAIRHLVAAGISVVGVSPTLMQSNVDEASALIDLALSLGAHEIQLVQLCRVGRGATVEELTVEQILVIRHLIEDKAAKHGRDISISGSEGIWKAKPFCTPVLEGQVFPSIMGCGAGRTCMAIGPNGKVRACLLYQQPIGDLAASSLEQLWQTVPSEQLMHLRSVKEGCLGCNYASVCSGPCPMERCATPEERRCFVETSRGRRI